MQKKTEGEEITVAQVERPRAEVIDLMEALKKSLGQGGRRAPVRAARHEEPAKKTARR